MSGHTRILAYSMELESAMFGRNAIDMHGPIATLCSNVFVEWVPCDALDVMVVLSNLVDALAC